MRVRPRTCVPTGVSLDVCVRVDTSVRVHMCVWVRFRGSRSGKASPRSAGLWEEVPCDSGFALVSRSGRRSSASRPGRDGPTGGGGGTS